MDITQSPAGLLLLYIIVPAWFIAGIGDWYCHKVADVEHTAGQKESFFHLLMFVQGGIALLMGLFLEVNTLVILALLVLLIFHEITAIIDVSYAYKMRKILPIEQHIHAFLEIIPFTAIILIIILHWHQAITIFEGGITNNFSIRWKNIPLPSMYVISVLLGAAGVFVLYCEELYRCRSVKENNRP